jgi:hypothetical protein
VVGFFERGDEPSGCGATELDIYNRMLEFNVHEWGLNVRRKSDVPEE